jgi:hypothetical protein
MAGARALDASIVERLVFECVTPPINKAYRDSFALGMATVVRLYLRSNRRPAAPGWPAAPVLCFGAFRNEHAAIAEAIAAHPDWRRCDLDLRQAAGLDWSAVLAPAPALLLPFLRAARAAGGARAARNFAMPFIGYLIYLHLREEFARMSFRPTVLTTNLVHPLSLAAHLAARASGLRTVFWEHAMTPRLIIRAERGYDEYHLNCEHTRRAFIEAAIEPQRLFLKSDVVSPRAVPLALAPRRVGVCVNDLDELGHTRELLRALERAGYETVLRAHDSDIRFRRLRRLARECRATFSNAGQSTITTFMGEVDLVIAGNSNVLLDCLRAAKPVLYFWPGEPQLFDYYGVVAEAGCEHFAAAADLVSRIDRLDGRHHASV